MRIALLIAGYLRSYENNIDYIKKEILNKFKDVDVYLHITKNENEEDKYLNQIEESDISFITNELKPISTIIENNTYFSDDKKINNTMNHWNKLHKLNHIKKINESSNGVKYDLVIRYRLDLEIKSENVFDLKIDDYIYIPIDSKIDKTKLINLNDDHICDALSFGKSEIMDEYFKIYEVLPKLIIRHGHVSETILSAYLKNNNLKYKLIDINYSFILSKCNVFAICGDSGSGKSTLSDLLKSSFTDSFKLECDRYHKWERNDTNWTNLTHLNPNANFITKMNEDVFNLKIGNEIYQVDYDHHTGKFTDKQLINPTNNLIVCGLHSLSVDHTVSGDTLYNLKIYMDTDDTLKKKWKISRDVTERGYSVEQVLQNMKKREKDYTKYIDPQKENADLIIRFFTNDTVNFTELEKEPNISLELSIKKSFNINNVLNKLNVLEINYQLITENNLNRIVFEKYEKTNIIDEYKVPISNNFYDYILFFIFHLNLTNT